MSKFKVGDLINHRRPYSKNPNLGIIVKIIFVNGREIIYSFSKHGKNNFLVKDCSFVETAKVE